MTTLGRLSASKPLQKAAWRRLASRGASAMEFALVAPVIILVLFFSLEMGIVMWADATLEVAASRVSRIGQIGVPEGMDCEEAVRETYEDLMSSWVPNRADLKVDVRVYQPGGDNEPDPDADPMCDAGERGDMIIYRLSFEHPGFSGIMSWLGISLLRYERTVILQNEP